MTSMRSPALITSILLLCAGIVSSSANDAAKVDFNYDIRPIISAKCYHCHGPDEKSRKAKLRLDLREEAIKEREGVRAVVPGNPDVSELLLRIESHDKDEVMPPPKEGERLTSQEIGLLKRWITQGAEYKEHWAWTKPERPAVPSALDFQRLISDWEKRAFTVNTGQPYPRTDIANWPKNPIDAFILARLLQSGLFPSQPADLHTLCRRLYLDLIGLPPAPAELQQFVDEATHNRKSAVEKLVDRLLASPHFGEKWARMWLDLARYADSTGYGSDKFRLNIWPYRDWVINAFNRNLSYDQFTLEQLAGDLLPNATPDQIVATAFHRNTMTNVEGGTIDEEYRVAAVKDRVATTGQTWMGLTVGCAQCHTHKFDPISHKEYYQLFAIFNQTEDSDREDEAPTMVVPTSAQRDEMERLKSEISLLERRQNETSSEFETEQAEWEAEMARNMDWHTLVPLEIKTKGDVRLEAQPDGAILATGENPGKDTYSITLRTDLRTITAIRLEALTDTSLPNNGPGRASNGNAVLSEFSVSIAPKTPKPVPARYVRIEAPGENRILALAEVEIFADGQKIRPNGGARQSSTDFGGEAKRAIDGKTNGDYMKANTVTHTRQEANPWWEVDLGVEVSAEKLKIWNRTDGGLGYRLVPARIVFLDKDRQPVWDQMITEAPAPSGEWSLTGERNIALKGASSDFSQPNWEIANAIDGNDKTGWAFAPESGKPHAAVFELKKPVTPVEEEAVLKVTLKQSHGDRHTLGRFRLQATSHIGPVREVPKHIRNILALEPSERETTQRDELTNYFRPLSKYFTTIQQQLEVKRKELAAIKPVAVPVLRELAGKNKRKTHLLTKGNYLAPEEEVPSGIPVAFAKGFHSQTIDRLALANWLTSPENPLTARVTVNRFWAQLFGTGLVETEEDFGTQGALPSHPELLDWLAVAFQSSPGTGATQLGLAWDVKALIKLIVTSATYEQASKVDPVLLEKDPRNRLLARYPRRRLDAEGVRDQALALSGLLSRKLGGPSVYPPQPDGLWKVAFNGGQNSYPTSKGEDRYRRGLYTFWRRTMPYPGMSTFDAPSRESCTIRRVPTNTPLQAFVTLNDPTFVECAQALARRIMREGGSDAPSQIRFAIELVLSRPATAEQVATIRQLLDAELDHYRRDKEAARKLSTSETQQFPENCDPSELAAWTVVANVLLNLDGVLMKS